MDIEYWKQRALEAETALKGAAGTAVDATKAGAGAAIDATKAGAGAAWDATKAGAGAAVDATKGAASDLETMFLDQFAAPPQSPAPLPDDPINQAIPPHLRQFYGAEGNYGQPPEAEPDPGMMDQALKAAEDAFNSVMKMGKGPAQRPAGPMPPQFPGGAAHPAPGVRVPGR